MRITFADLWRPSGTITRRTYGLVGLLLFALKHNLDRLVAFYAFHRAWGLFSYWVPLQEVMGITELRASQAVFLATMVALALPFIWIGVVLTLKRLRSAGLPMPLVGLFFVPYLNLLFFLFLCLVPERDTRVPESLGTARRSLLARMVPQSGSRQRGCLDRAYGPARMVAGGHRGTSAGELWVGPVRGAAICNGIHGGNDLRNSPTAQPERMCWRWVPLGCASGPGPARGCV